MIVGGILSFPSGIMSAGFWRSGANVSDKLPAIYIGFMFLQCVCWAFVGEKSGRTTVDENSN